MKTGYIRNSYDLPSFPQLKDESNHSSFLKQELKIIKQHTNEKGVEIKVQKVYDVVFEWEEQNRYYILDCKVKYKIVK